MIAAELLLFSSSIQGVQIVSWLQGVYNWSIISMLLSGVSCSHSTAWESTKDQS